MHATLPWPVSPEFEDALALATQRHLAQPPSSPHQHHASLATPSSTSITSIYDHSLLSPDSVPRSASLMMKTRVAVRDKTPHRFQVVPLRDAAQNRDKADTKHLSEKQPPAPWTRQLAALRPSGVGLGLSVPIQLPDTPERGRDRTRGEVLGGEAPAPRKGILRGLQGLSPKRPLGSPDRKENRTPGGRDGPRTPTTRGRRRRGLENAGDKTITSKTIQEIYAIPAYAALQTQEAAPKEIPRPQSIQAGDVAVARVQNTQDARVLSRHFKSPSLGAIHHLLSASTSGVTSAAGSDDTPRVRCRKRTNTLSAAKRYGVYTPGTLDFSPVVPVPMVLEQTDSMHSLHSTYSLGALLAAYSYDSLPSVYSQDSFVEHAGTRPLRVRVRERSGHGRSGQPHAIMLQLIQEVDVAIGEWL